MKNLTQEDWRAEVAKDPNAVIIDVRTAEECTSGIVENALMFDFFQPDFFQREIMKLDNTKTYFVYCRSGNRSAHACQMMEGLGFQNVVNLMGGMLAWDADKVRP